MILMGLQPVNKANFPRFALDFRAWLGQSCSVQNPSPRR